MMPPLLNRGIFCFALAAGCAGVEQAPPGVLAQSGPLLVDASLVGRGQDAAAAPEAPRSEASRETIELAPPPAPRPQPAPSGGEASAKETAAPAPAPPSPSAAKAAAPSAKAPAKVSAPPPAIEPPRKSDAPAPVARAAEPPLDVAALKERLRETNAIGMFTKLALKNQVDDLLQQFRAQHLNGQKTNVAALRQAYDMLVLKVLALIQDSDPSLARTIAGSREAIWGILADPVKFKAVN